ncbi:MAG: hypothetical protein ABI140_21810 [Jatrophihabitantaceae bacterium]
MFALADGLLGLISEIRISQRPGLATLASGLTARNTAALRADHRTPRTALSILTAAVLVTGATSALTRAQAVRLVAHRIWSWSQATPG